ncbi:MAG: vitamin K epoxide reductase family protein [Gemmatimonadaceae bacterium]|nr:vitamin K epoxide reductase family protein [Gemmatimonadaceae bacterium]MCW5826944.1 vitamin K epoxide reductase family protein [Gemmatimonadaceae bacterium]
MTPSVHPAPPRDGLLGLSWRQLVALIALGNAFVATYLHLWKIGKAGQLACGGSGGCAVVQYSPWSYFFGVDVAFIGAVGYVVLFLVALVGSLERFRDLRGVAFAQMALVYPAVLFTLRLKWAEFYKLRTFCPWCAISAVSITLLAVIVWMEWRRVRDIPPR